MKTDDKIIADSIKYLNTHKKEFLTQYTSDISATQDKVAYFTAGMSGVGKTELTIFLKENHPNLLHIDTDEIREFFRVIGYDGQNSTLYQKVASRGFNELFKFLSFPSVLGGNAYIILNYTNTLTLTAKG